MNVIICKNCGDVRRSPLVLFDSPPCSKCGGRDFYQCSENEYEMIKKEKAQSEMMRIEKSKEYLNQLQKKVQENRKKETKAIAPSAAKQVQTASRHASSAKALPKVGMTPPPLPVVKNPGQTPPPLPPLPNPGHIPPPIPVSLKKTRKVSKAVPSHTSNSGKGQNITRTKQKQGVSLREKYEDLDFEDSTESDIRNFLVREMSWWRDHISRYYDMEDEFKIHKIGLRKAGEELDRRGGFELMRKIGMGLNLDPATSRSLEMAWDGIGKWLG